MTALVNGARVDISTSQELTEALKHVPAGRPVTIEVDRDSTRLAFDVASSTRYDVHWKPSVNNRVPAFLRWRPSL